MPTAGTGCRNNGSNSLPASGTFVDYVPVVVTYTVTPCNYQVTGTVNSSGNGYSTNYRDYFSGRNSGCGCGF